VPYNPVKKKSLQNPDRLLMEFTRSPSGCVAQCNLQGFKGLDQESWKSLHPDGLHQESIWSIPGVHQDSLMVYNGCCLERGPDGLLMDSRWTPGGLQDQFLESIRIRGSVS
jgi:hypothetical protein